MNKDICNFNIKESLYLHICSSNDTVKSKIMHKKENQFQIVTFFQHVFQSFKVCNKVWIIAIIIGIEIDCDLLIWVLDW